MARKRDDDDRDDEDDDRPRRRRRDDDDRDDDRPQPRSKRSRDEVYEELPRKPRHRAEDEDDEYEERPRPQRKKGAISRANLRVIAIFQKVILVCLAIYVFGAAAITCLVPPEAKWLWALIAIPVLITSAVFTFLLAVKVYNPGVGVLLGLLTLAPIAGFLFPPLVGVVGIFVSLLVLVLINGQATSTLKKHGISVGLFGASLSDIE